MRDVKFTSANNSEGLSAVAVSATHRECTLLFVQKKIGDELEHISVYQKNGVADNIRPLDLLCRRLKSFLQRMNLRYKSRLPTCSHKPQCSKFHQYPPT